MSGRQRSCVSCCPAALLCLLVNCFLPKGMAFKYLHLSVHLVHGRLLQMNWDALRVGGKKVLFLSRDLPGIPMPFSFFRFREKCGSCLSNGNLGQDTHTLTLTVTYRDTHQHDNQIKAPAIWLMCMTALPRKRESGYGGEERGREEYRGRGEWKAGMKMLKSEAEERRRKTSRWESKDKNFTNQAAEIFV